MAAVGLVDVAGHEHVVARAECDLPSGQEGRLLAGLLGQNEVVGGDDQGDALVLEVSDDGQQGVPVGLVQAVEGLIEEDEAGPGGHAAGHEDALLLAAGQGAEAPVGAVGQTHALKGLQRPTTGLGTRAPQDAELGVHAHLDHLPHGDGEGGVEVAELRNVSDGPPWRSARCRPVDTHPAPADGHHAEQCPHECRLARAVGAHEGEGLPGRDPTSDTGEHGGGAVGEGGVLQGDDWFGSSGQGGRGGHRGSAITGVCHTVPHLTSEALGLHWARSAGISVTVPPQALVRLETLWRMEPM